MVATVCCICGQPIPVKVLPNGGTWELGNNAQPVVRGMCCDECDNNVVIPARVVALYVRRGRTREEAEKSEIKKKGF